MPIAQDNVSKARKTKGSYILIVLLLLITALYFLVFDLIVPKMAAFTTPQKWRMIPLRQTKAVVYDYLGEPVIIRNGIDEWAGGTKGKMYYLRMYYVSDTIASGYAIHYQYSNSLISRDYLIDSTSIH
ncbi:MAG: hypothetical protein V4450_02410 [Bacteroidota bacterium]